MVGSEDETWPRRILDPPLDPWLVLEADIRHGRGRPSHVNLWYHANEGVLTSEREGALVAEISFLDGTLRSRDFTQSSEVIRIGEPVERGFANVTDPFLGPLRLLERRGDEEWDLVTVGTTRQFVSRRRDADMKELVVGEMGLPMSARYRGGLVRWTGLTLGTAAGPPEVNSTASEGWRREHYRMLSREAVFEPLGGSAPERVANLLFEDAFEYQSARLPVAHRHVSWRSEGRELNIVIRPARPADSESANLGGGSWTTRLRGAGASKDREGLGWVAHIFAPPGMTREEAFAPLAGLDVIEPTPLWTFVGEDQSSDTPSKDQSKINENTRTREAGGDGDDE